MQGANRVTTARWQNRIVGHAEVSPADLVPNPKNWRTHPAEQQRALTGALSEVGWVGAMLVNRTTGHVVDGHLRIELALARKEPSVPVSYVELTADEERLVLATLDPIGALADAEATALADLLAGLEPADDGLRALLDDLARQYGIDGAGGFVDPDDVPEIPAEPTVQRGELYVLGDHRLLCGDATNPDEVARLLDGAEPTLLATGPPYGVELDPTWRDGIYNALGPAEPGYMLEPPNEDAPTGHRRTKGHRNTTVSGDTRIDWSAAFALVPSLTVGYVWLAGVYAGEVAAGPSACPSSSPTVPPFDGSRCACRAKATEPPVSPGRRTVRSSPSGADIRSMSSTPRVGAAPDHDRRGQPLADVVAGWLPDRLRPGGQAPHDEPRRDRHAGRARRSARRIDRLDPVP